jgi:hypothetical protein
MEGAVIELRSGLGVTPPPSGSHIEGRPSKAALDAMLSYFGWTFEYFDWTGAGLTVREHVADYEVGQRVTVLVRCNDGPVPPEVRAQAVRSVFETQPSCPSQWRAIREVAPKFGMTPEALRFWVTQTERELGSQPRPRRAPRGR